MGRKVKGGAFITLEGGEGSGKSSQAKALADLLRGEGYEVTLTSEPSGTPLGETVMDVFRRGLEVSPEAELFLFEAARAQNVRDVVRPALERGEVVVCDRFVDSTTAYQGNGRGLNLEQVRALNHLATGGLLPQLTILLDVPPETGLARQRLPAGGQAASEEADSIGGESLTFHNRVREGFLEMARSEPERFVIVDASLSADKVTELAWGHVRQLLDRLERLQE